MHRRVPLWSSIRQMTGARRHNGSGGGKSFPAGSTKNSPARCGCRERWEAQQRTSSSPHPFRPLGYDGFSDVRWQSLFEDCDINGALSHSEMRHPFLDLRLLQYMLALPAMPWCRNKLIIRRSMRTALPRRRAPAKENGYSGEPRFQAGPRVRISPAGAVAGSVEIREPRSRFRPRRKSSLELRAALRPLGLNYWLQDLATTVLKGDL